MAEQCQLCSVIEAKYVCPRCNIRYCSMDCYKSEGHADCSEQFYKDCFIDGLKDFNSSSEDKQSMMEMLEKLESDTADADLSDSEDLAERLEGLDLDRDTDKVWQRLSKSEKETFYKMLNDGRLSELIYLWEPWWKLKDTKLIDDMGSPKKLQMNHPKVKTEITAMANLLHNKSPSPNMKYSVINVIYAYAYIARLHDGEHLESALTAATELMNIGEALNGLPFNSSAEAICHCIQTFHDKAKSAFVSRECSVVILQDVKLIIEGPSRNQPVLYIMAALSDALHLIKKARKMIEKEAEIKSDPEDLNLKSRFFHVMKKLDFLISWSHDYGYLLEDTIPDIMLEFGRLSTELALHLRDSKKMFQIREKLIKEPEKKTLIEEL